MKIFISDIHLGDKSGSEDFQYDKEFLDFLKWTDGKASEIVILGDLYELWQSRLEKIIWKHYEVIQALQAREKKITYIFGNHDFLPFARTQPEYCRQDNIYAVHGHQFDEYNKLGNPLKSIKWPIGRWVTLAVGEIERWFSPDADKWLQKQREKLGDFYTQAAVLQSRKWNHKDPKQVEAKVDYLKKVNNAKINIFGHTHKPEVCRMNIYEGLEEDDLYIYANCGSWVGPNSPTFIAVEKNSVQLRNGLNFQVINEVSID